MSSLLKSKHFIIGFDAFIFVICILGIYHLFEKSWIGVGLVYQSGQIAVRYLDNEQTQNFLQKGDIIIVLDNQKVTNIEDLEFICDSHRIGDDLIIEVLRKENEIAASIKLVPYNSISYLIILFIVGCIFFFLGLFVLTRAPDDNVSNIFHWISITVSIHIMTTWGNLAVEPRIIGILMRGIFLFASSLTPILFVHLSFIFPRTKWGNYYKVIRPFYVLALFSSVLLTINFIYCLNPPLLGRFNQFMFYYNLGRWIFAIFLIFGVANFIHSYFRAIEESERRKLRWVILGLAIGPLSFVFLWQIPQTFYSVGLVSEEIILLLSTITPLAFAISIIRYHILDIDYLFNRSSVYFLAITVILIIYTSMVGITAVLVGTFTTKISVLVSAVAAVIIAILFEPARRAAQKLVDRKFFRVRYNYRLAQRKFSEEMNRSLDIRFLADYLVDNLEKLLQLKRISFFLYSELDDRWMLLAQRNWVYISPRLLDQLIQYSYHSKQHIIATARYLEQGIQFEEADKEFCKNNKIALALPIRLENTKTIGFLILSCKKSKSMFSVEDVDLLKTITGQIGLAIERIRLQQSLILQNAETKRLDELSTLKSYFVSSVSHELQTPLTSIRMFAELLKTKKKLPEDKRKEYLSIIEGESERLSRLIKNVLDFSRVERGVKEYRFAATNLIDVIKKSLQSMKYQLRENGFELQTKIPEDPLIISIDSDAIVEALTNLISNAIKYSLDNKHIFISVTCDKNFATIQVKDKGVGISTEDKDKIFDTFYRAEDVKIQSMGGAGLGLTLVQHIVEAHNGRIEVESEPGRGSTFILFLPLEE